jgi:hypothetical protein
VTSEAILTEIRAQKAQVESRYIYTPSGTPAALDVMAPVAPRWYRAQLYGAAGTILCLCIVSGVWAWERNHKNAPHEPALIAPTATTGTEQALRVFVPDFIMAPFHFWLVRADIKECQPVDAFTLMRFTNLTNGEIMVETLNLEILGRVGQPPFNVVLLNPDGTWPIYGGMSSKYVLPATFDRGFMHDVVRQPIPAGHTVYGIGLFQIPRFKDLSVISGLSVHITDMRGQKYDVDAIFPVQRPQEV